ncbi:MAG TPA: FHA domain-containing protein [Candidatus Binataceae bacterium]|nr:FHA domain-containing protein [Candidatus Binataceae bacterium]
MASNVSSEKLLFYAAAGGLGGFAAWGAAEPILGIHSVYARDILFGALIGAFIAAFLASIEALSVGQWRLAIRSLVTGGTIGAIGGALGLIVAELAFDILGGLNGRILGWSVLGVFVGLGVGASSQSAARRRNGAIGGIVGGALGGFVYQALTSTFPQAFGRAIAIIVLGALIGFFIGLVGELLKRGWLMVVRSASRNAREGREYPLTKPVTIIGRAEESDIGLFGDQNVLGHHAIIRREGRNFVITATGGGQVFVNRQQVNGKYSLKSGDRLEVGGTLFLFRERAQAARQ